MYGTCQDLIKQHIYHFPLRLFLRLSNSLVGSDVLLHVTFQLPLGTKGLMDWKPEYTSRSVFLIDLIRSHCWIKHAC